MNRVDSCWCCLDDRHLGQQCTGRSTLRYIHLSGRELSDKLANGMAHIHAWRVQMLTAPAAHTGLVDPQ